MRFPLLMPLLLVGVLSIVVSAWSKEDYEIFRLRDEVELHEGDDVTFYDFIGVKSGPSASQAEIEKAYRKTSVRLHPDKYRPSKSLSKAAAKEAKKQANERFARLGVVAAILKGPGRDRYDHFLKNGFPKWRGTGYYYARFRPGLGSVVIGVWLAAGVAHYGILFLNARQQKQFMASYISEARAAAWGSSGVPGLQGIPGLDGATEQPAAAAPAGNRKERRAQRNKREKSAEGGSGTATPVGNGNGGRRKVVSENGKAFIVDSIGNVFLVEDTEDGQQEYPLDLEDIEGPKWRNTILATLPRWMWRKTIGRVLGGGVKAEDAEEIEEEYEEEDLEETDGNGDLLKVPKKKGVPKKVERAGEGVPRRRVKGRTSKK